MLVEMTKAEFEGITRLLGACTSELDDVLGFNTWIAYDRFSDNFAYMQDASYQEPIEINLVDNENVFDVNFEEPDRSIVYFH